MRIIGIFKLVSFICCLAASSIEVCTAGRAPEDPAAKAVTGVNLGGWMVLEPWITPSLFYQFLGKKHSEGVGMDSWTFCAAKGPELGNRWMRAHWDAWYTEDHIAELARRAVKRVRLPIGDWTLTPYGPYAGCMDGAAEKIDWMLDTCHKYGIEVLIDVHTARGSQNGFDNGGRAWFVSWQSENNFTHVGEALWMGDWDRKQQRYRSINWSNIKWSIEQAELFLKRWGSHPALLAYEPVNEPWRHSEISVLKYFYKEVRKLVQKYAPKAYFVFHDSFRLEKDIWYDLFEDGDTELVAIDHHGYMAWYQNMTEPQEFCDAFEQDAKNADALSGKYEVWKGEWALGTDACAHWLGGLNDGTVDMQFPCKEVDCPYTYIKNPPGPADFDRTAATLGPYGNYDERKVAIHSGKCWTDSAHFNHTQVTAIAQCVTRTIDTHFNSSFMWTAHNEIEEKWDYVKAWDLGWVNQTAVDEAPIQEYIRAEEEYKKKEQSALDARPGNEQHPHKPKGVHIEVHDPHGVYRVYSDGEAAFIQ